MYMPQISAVEALPLERSRSAIDRRTARQMIELTVAAALSLPPEELSAKTRRAAPVAFARQISMYCAHVTLGWSLTEAGAVFSRDRTTAAHACRVVEDRRDDVRIDRLVQTIEDALHNWILAVESCAALKVEAME